MSKQSGKRSRAAAYRIVAVVHAETSTGVRNPVKEIGELLKGSDTIYLVDTVTSLGGIEVRMDDWGIDALYSGTQKCLSCPPGLAPLSFSEKAMAKLNGRKAKVPNWYLDLTMIAKYWGTDRVYHHTAPVNMIYALYEALQLFFEEGPQSVFSRHLESHAELVKELGTLGLNLLVKEKFRLPMLNAVRVPEEVDELAVRQAPARRFPDRDRRRPGPPEGQDLARRPDGSHRQAGERGQADFGPETAHIVIMIPERRRFRPKVLYPYHYGDTDVKKLEGLLKKEKGIEVRVRNLK